MEQSPTIYMCIEIAELEILTVRMFDDQTVARQWFDSKCEENSLDKWDSDELFPNIGPGMCKSPIHGAGDDVHAALVYVGNVEFTVK